MRKLTFLLSCIFLLSVFTGCNSGKDNLSRIQVDWNKIIRVSESTPTLQIVPNPSHQRNSPLHDPLWNALSDLEADFVRYSPWGEYLNLKIAELEPPSRDRASWDFSALDPIFIDFMNANDNRPFIMNFQAIPGWMLKSPKPADPGPYISGLFRDPTGKELADYFARIVSWYSKGGFQDELGHWHESGYHYDLKYWEVLNEPDHESIGLTKELYTALYDAVVEEILKVEPDMKFMGLSMSNLPLAPEWTAYFLDSTHHKPGIPLNLVSYHMYATLRADQKDPEKYPASVFEQADRHFEIIRTVDSIRQELSPQTIVDINESGILFKEVPKGWGRMDGDSIPDLFWNLSAAYYAYLYAGLARQGIEMVGESTLWSDPVDWPEVSLVDWKTGKPNARYWALKMIRDNLGPGDKLVVADVKSEDPENPVFAQGFISERGVRKILLVNKSPRTQFVSIQEDTEIHAFFVDPDTGFDPPSEVTHQDNSFILKSFGVAILVLPL